MNGKTIQFHLAILTFLEQLAIKLHSTTLRPKMPVKAGQKAIENLETNSQERFIVVNQ